MGPHPLWLLEELCENMDLRPGMKVLDMGCGKGLTSVFLAKEYGVTVFANDLWISPTENLRRFEEAGVADLVYPIHAEAHALPYANEFFDAAISIDSYHYYGADELYFPCTYSKLVKPGGQFGIAIPGYTKEFESGCPDTLRKAWEEDIGAKDEMYAFHSGAWWRRLWEKTGIAKITACYNFEEPKAAWQPWADWCVDNFAREFAGGEGKHDSEVKFLAADTENDLAIIIMAATKHG